MYIIDRYEENNNKKYIIQLQDGYFIEAALFEHRNAIHFCIPSQVGCCVGCRHCSTTYAQVPYVRNLSSRELNNIVELLITQLWNKNIPKVLSFSGHGEPMMNWENIQKCARDNINRFLNIYLTSIGIVCTMHEILLGLDFYPNIYFSLHASCDNERAELIPLAGNEQIANLQQIIEFGKYYTQMGGQVIWNYMICNVNSSDESFQRLLGLCRKVDYSLDIRFTKYIDIRKNNKIKEIDSAVSKAFCQKISEQVSSNIHVRFSTLEGEEMGIACGQMRAFLQDEK